MSHPSLLEVDTVDLPDSESVSPPLIRSSIASEWLASKTGLEPSSRYVAIEEVGHGGFAHVLRAYDTTLQREVALKVLRNPSSHGPSADTLVEEARAMAMLSHPNVVGVYDVVDLDHQLLLVLEYVPGQTLRTWVRSETRSHREILRAFIAAGRGLAAAHDSGLLHRDFKPSNVLVGEEGAIKVTDFGLALPAEGGSASTDINAHLSARVTAHPLGVAGTPRYMAPEQFDAAPLSPAADQYAFCVALWEALCGAPPFEGTSPKRLQAAKRRGPPAWPRAEDLARRAAAVPDAVRAAICRGLAVDPDARWPSMSALLDALDHERSSRWSRWLPFAGAVAAIVLGASLHAAMSDREGPCSGASEKISPTWNDQRRTATRESLVDTRASSAVRAADRAVARLDDYAQSWTTMHRQACEATVIRGEQSATLMDLRMTCLERARVDLHAVVDVLVEADEGVVYRAHRLTDSLPPLSRCADTEVLQADVAPPRPGDAEAVRRARGRLSTATAQREAYHADAARAEIEAAEAIAHSTHYDPLKFEVSLAKGRLELLDGNFDAAVPPFREALALASASRDLDGIQQTAHLLMRTLGIKQKHFEAALHYRELAEGLAGHEPQHQADVAMTLALIEQARGRFDDATKQHHRAITTLEALGDPDSLSLATARLELADTLEFQAKFDEAQKETRTALRVLEEQLGPDHPNVAVARYQMASRLQSQGRVQEAEAELQHVLGVMSRSYGPDHPNVGAVENSLGILMVSRGRDHEAAAHYEKALKIFEAKLGPDHPNVGSVVNNLAGIHLRQGQLDAAEQEFRWALSITEQTLGPEHPTVVTNLVNIGHVFRDRDDPTSAEEHYRKALALSQKIAGDEHPDSALSRHFVAQALRDQGRLDQALEYAQSVVTTYQKILDPRDVRIAKARASLAGILLELGRAPEALPLAEQAWERHEQGGAPAYQARSAFALARAQWATHADHQARARAVALARRALALLDESSAGTDDLVTQIEAWLDTRVLDQ